MIELTINKEDISRINNLLSELDPKKQDGAVRKGIDDGSKIVFRQLVANVSGIILHRRTGNLAKSMGWRVDKDEQGNWQGTIGSGASLRTDRMIYADILETGGVIKPRPENKTGFLWIPIRAGSQYAIEQGMWNYKTGARAGQTKRRISYSSKILRWIPVRQVTIPAFRYMAQTVEQTQGQVVQAILNKIKEAKEKP